MKWPDIGQFSTSYTGPNSGNFRPNKELLDQEAPQWEKLHEVATSKDLLHAPNAYFQQNIYVPSSRHEGTRLDSFDTMNYGSSSLDPILFISKPQPV